MAGFIITCKFFWCLYKSGIEIWINYILKRTFSDPGISRWIIIYGSPNSIKSCVLISSSVARHRTQTFISFEIILKFPLLIPRHNLKTAFFLDLMFLRLSGNIREFHYIVHKFNSLRLWLSSSRGIFKNFNFMQIGKT